MARASSDAMDRLHASVAILLTEELKRAKVAAEQPRTIFVAEKGEQPNPAFSPLNPQLLDKVLKFLKDNGIDSPAKNAAINGLAMVLDDLDLDNLHPN